jgi:peptidyl-prolyl cis-trans isomerase SurA
MIIRLSYLIFFSLISISSNAQEIVVAKVNNKIITSFEVEDRYKFVLAASGIKIKNSEDNKILRNQIIDKMIDEELIRQESEKLKLSVSSEELRDAIEIVALQRKENPTQFKIFFVKRGLSFENYLKQLETEILWSKITNEVLRSKVKITDVEVNEFFEQYQLNSDVRKFLLAELVIAPLENSEKLANKLSDELRAGADFKAIIKQFSSAISSENNGEIGWVSQGEINKKIYEAIFKLRKGAYSNPVLLDDGYHIFKLLDAKVETNISDQDLNAAKNKIFNLKLQNLAKGYMMELHKRSFIER